MNFKDTKESFVQPQFYDYPIVANAEYERPSYDYMEYELSDDGKRPIQKTGPEVLNYRKQNGQVTTVKFVPDYIDPSDMSYQRCDSGHDLLVVMRTKKMDYKCFKCLKTIALRAQCITCTGNCGITYCLDCSGCPNAHVLHMRRIHLRQ